MSKLVFIAMLTFSIVSLDKHPNRSSILFLSIVLICSNKITDFFSKNIGSIMTCVGKSFFVILDDIGATITVVEYLFPLLFCRIKTGLYPPCWCRPPDPEWSGIRLRKRGYAGRDSAASPSAARGFPW